MRRFFFSIFIVTLLSACAGSQGLSNGRIGAIQNLSGATVVDNAHMLLWLEQRALRPVQLQVLVLDEQGEQFQAAYLWRENRIREMKRVGRMRMNETWRPFTLHVRYDTEGTPVFQRFELEGKRLPLKELELHRYYQQGEQAVELLKVQQSQSYSLYEGVLADGELTDCDGRLMTLDFVSEHDRQAYSTAQQHQGRAFLMAKRGFMSGGVLLKEAHWLGMQRGETGCFSPAVNFD